MLSFVSRQFLLTLSKCGKAFVSLARTFTQFMYDPCGIGRQLKQYVYVNLGTWHTYKHASLVVWRRFGEVFLAGLYHHLYPNSKFKTNERLAAITQVFVYVRMAYPDFRDQLNAALAKINLSPQSRTCLQNLKDLCEFYIPVVQ
jgi:hypothetical protein